MFLFCILSGPQAGYAKWFSMSDSDLEALARTIRELDQKGVGFVAIRTTEADYQQWLRAHGRKHTDNKLTNARTQFEVDQTRHTIETQDGTFATFYF
ncbi:MAG: hypothetical protein HKM24_02250 [Gammaproteobacteria bacterium]|nr:hypothetical protein [Gammaproteobacteria bacterium]